MNVLNDKAEHDSSYWFGSARFMIDYTENQYMYNGCLSNGHYSEFLILNAIIVQYTHLFSVYKVFLDRHM